ncbi:hypothetical protein V5O48_005256 [Marasmius crinis-equi]|uniref:C2H2-type domain-containing protein n=1 Tax=Marasmius crinis-equi TaxID=585013 RepID=A0ABR3FMW3_9AGAR
MRTKFAEPFLNTSDLNWHSLRTLVDTAWGVFLRQQERHMQRVAPDSTVIALLPAFRDVILLGCQTALNVEELHRHMVARIDSINRWNVNMEQSVMVQILQYEHGIAVREFYQMEGQDLPRPSANGLERRNLATVKVLCSRCNGSYSSVATAMRHFNRNGLRCIDRFIIRPTMLTLVYSPASVALVWVSGLDPASTSCHTMDLIWAAYQCLSCCDGFKGNWRECVQHSRRAGHQLLNDGQVLDYRRLFARLDSKDHDLRHPENDKPAWTCAHCARFVCQPATRDQIEDHVVRAHDADAANISVPVDFFYIGL